MIYDNETGRRIDQDRPIRVVVTNLDISFGNMLGLMIKMAVAAVPAAIIMAIVYIVIIAAFVGGS